MPVSPTAVRPGGYRTGFSLLLLLLALAVASSVRAAGWAPFARDDQALVTRGGTVTVLQDGASSVLQNDFDIEGDKLSAQLTGEPKEGFVQLNDDGTFSYTHNGNNKNKDEFKYRAFDGTAYSREARVRIDIEDVPNTPPYTIGTMEYHD
ncbi:MAG: cadherin-like domain-containing protein [Woeseiaceae bacterium]|nr:cadherin-like domain-containing protein [Woeseiaceae bacterium]